MTEWNGTLTAALDRVKRLERELVGILATGDAPVRLLDNLDAERFYDAECREAVKAAKRLTASGRPVNITSLFDELEPHEGPREGWAAWLADCLRLAEKVGRSLIETIGVLDQEQTKLAAFQTLATTSNTLLDPASRYEDALGELEQRMRSVLERTRFTTVRDCIESRLTEGRPTSTPVGCLGIPRIDEASGLIRAGNMFVLAARPGVGKTAMAVQAAVMTARVTESDVLFLTAEQPAGELADRFTAWYEGVSLKDLRDGTAMLTGESLAAPEMGKIHIVEVGGRTIDAVVGVIESAIVRSEVRFVILDYLQLLRARDPRKSRYEHVTEVSNVLKRTSVSLGVGTLALAQLSRGSERRTDQTPRLHDLRDSGAIEQDADAVCMLYRGQVHGSGALKHILVADLQKNRHGPLAQALLGFDLPTGRIYEIQEDAVEIPF